MGARTDTTSNDPQVFEALNLSWSKELWKICANNEIPMVYASSAATYGLGEHGFSDSHSVAKKLKPLNLYAKSKQDFDLWAMKQKEAPPFWAGVKFFNVYGPNEYHKGRMASVVFHAFRQIRETGKMKLFRSHREDVQDGEQSRDFIYVTDALDICFFLKDKAPESGLYNAGTGKARTFLDLTHSVFAAMGLPPEIDWIDTPEDIRDSYQYFTEADLGKLQKAGFKKDFIPLEEAVFDYVKNYLINGSYY
jgi:ADP-L-glycero-D-manno-heptose 6-epimerase